MTRHPTVGGAPLENRAAVARTAPHSDHHGPAGVLAGVLCRCAQGHARAISQTSLARRPHRSRPDPAGKTAPITAPARPNTQLSGANPRDLHTCSHFLSAEISALKLALCAWILGTVNRKNTEPDFGITRKQCTAPMNIASPDRQIWTSVLQPLCDPAKPVAGGCAVPP